MPGLAQLAGIGPVIEFGDRHVQVVGRRLRHLGEIESQILWIRKEPFAVARKLVSGIQDKIISKQVSEAAVKLIRQKYSGVTSSTLSKWLSSFEGRLFAVWQCIRDSGVPYDESLRTCCDSIDQYGLGWLEDIEWAIDVASNHAEFQQVVEIYNVRKASASTAGSDGFSNYDSIIRNLSREPYNMPLDVIVNLTLYQITVIARSPEDSMSDERDVEYAQMQSLGKIERDVLWGNRYGPLADNLSKGKHVMEGLRG